MPFQKILTWSKTQTTTTKIWTQVTDSISYDDNRFAKRNTQEPHCLGGGGDGFMPFQKILAWSKTQTTSSRTWTRVTDSIFNDDNRFAKLTVATS